ncbi:glycoside hydrolase [Bdellovibrio bacteriovorus]|uniref:sialidase family protein n=1 Tax=Bdellovibrio bacteriovorus TaxID=959 RepID=UPI0021D39D4F|nr:sialidase family protein [Bdellovibrio bacteriovorus]UXR63273.1 glycoside hydrolase [Bdellovibrio bacteriovorus]
MLQYFCTSRILFYVAVLFCVGCSLDASLIKDQISSTIDGEDGRIALSLTMDVGSAKAIEPVGGTPPYTYGASSSGYLDTTTGLYTIPPNAQVTEETLEVTDSVGKKFAVTVHRKGFREFRRIDMPQSVQDQNYLSDAVWLTSGAVLVTAVASDNSGERWATFRSTDDGANWSRVDHFMGVDYYGESHALSIAAKGNTVFTCGYGYSYDGTAQDPNSVWFVRKSTNGGTTWATVDSWWENAGDDTVCYDVAVSPLTGYIYTVGYSGAWADWKWVVRESKDDGATWQTIYQNNPAAGGGAEVSAYQVDISPSGHLFIMGRTGAADTMYFLKGTFAAGTWTWTPASSVPAVTNYGDYELRGNLQVVDDNTAYYSCRDSGSGGKIYKTTDAGVTWVQAYAGQDMLQGMTVTSAGTLIATGGSRSTDPNDWKVVSSADGVTWTPTDLDAMLAAVKDPYGLSVVAHPSNNKVLAFSYNDKGWQSSVAFSADGGGTWALVGEVRFQWAFWSQADKIIRTSATELYAHFDTGDMDGEWPWVIAKSSDNGATWQDSDRFLDPGNQWVEDLLQGHDGAVYVVGVRDANRIIRRSVDGSSWADVYSIPAVGYAALLATNKTSATYLVDNDGFNVFVRKSTNGTAWNLVSSLAPSGGASALEAMNLSADSEGNLYLVILEKAGALGTIVVHRSSDGGANWSEVLRGPNDQNYWSLKFTLRHAPSGDIWVYQGDSFLSSADHGLTWNPVVSAPAEALDVSWSGGQIYYLVSDPSHDYAVVTVGATLGSWVVLESLRQRQEDGDAGGEFEMDLVDRKFVVLGDSEVVLNYTYNDAYLGARNILRVIDTK